MVNIGGVPEKQSQSLLQAKINFVYRSSIDFVAIVIITLVRAITIVCT